MISREDYMKQKALEILVDRVESRMVNLGEVVPNVKVKKFNGEVVDLYDLLQDNHLILSFMRGSWWPFCRGELETLKGMSGYFKQVNAKVAVVTKDEIEETGFTGKGEALFDIEPEDLIMISDPSNSLGKILNLAYVAIEEMQGIYKELGIPGKVEGYYDTSELNVPATFILTQKEARIIFKYGKRDYGDRASGTEILKTLLSLRGPKG